MSDSKKETVFLTGSTGFLGSHIGSELLRKGETVYFLVRADNRRSGSDRLNQMLDWHGINPKAKRNARVIEGGLDDPGMGMDPSQRGQAGSRITRIIHCASDTSFSERKRRQVWKANVESLEELMDFAAQSKCQRFIHLSTAYAAGRRSGICREEFVKEKEFFNVYEESKAAAENYLESRCCEENIRLTIIRPSIVYGDSRTGRTLRFNALYYPVKAALFLKKIYREDILKHGGKKAAAAGVKIKSNGAVQLPLRIAVNDNGGVNLIPIDFLVNAFFAVTENPDSEGIFHIVNSRLTQIKDIITFACRQFKLEGIRPCSPEDLKNNPRNSLERLYERYLEAYIPYMRDTRIFSAEKTAPLLEREGIACPEFSEILFRRCMAYADKQGWS
ncbi:MAG: SDR family oxidoreductase [Candidatus Aminicenantes bacterium]